MFCKIVLFGVPYHCECLTCSCSGRLVSDQGSSGQKYDSLDSIPVDSETDSQYWTRQLMKAEESDPFRFV